VGQELKSRKGLKTRPWKKKTGGRGHVPSAQVDERLLGGTTGNMDWRSQGGRKGTTGREGLGRKVPYISYAEDKEGATCQKEKGPQPKRLERVRQKKGSAGSY